MAPPTGRERKRGNLSLKSGGQSGIGCGTGGLRGFIGCFPGSRGQGSVKDNLAVENGVGGDSSGDWPELDMDLCWDEPTDAGLVTQDLDEHLANFDFGPLETETVHTEPQEGGTWQEHQYGQRWK